MWQDIKRLVNLLGTIAIVGFVIFCAAALITGMVQGSQLQQELYHIYGWK